jgi:excisionase family DNA binding protein
VNQGSLVSISEASQMLGVSEATLRLWTDEGQIKAFVTPGGHRRYDLDQLKSFIASGYKATGIHELARELSQPSEIHQEFTRNPTQSNWRQRLTVEQGHEFMLLGNNLFDLIIRYIIIPAKRKNTLNMARSMGSEFGSKSASLGLSLIDAMEAFIQHRSNVMRYISRVMRKNQLHSKRITELLPLVNDIMDEALIAMVTAYQKAAAENNPQ